MEAAVGTRADCAATVRARLQSIYQPNGCLTIPHDDPFNLLMSPFSKGSADIARVLGQTRWRILVELCRRHMTASELAELVKTSANAVRVHLGALEEAGLVVYSVDRQKIGKPRHVYALTAAAESLLSKAYAPVLSAFLHAARQQLGAEFQPLMASTGQSLAASAEEQLTGHGIERAKGLLDGLGAPSEIVRSNGHSVLRAACCPLGAITRQSADGCFVLGTALSSVSGLTVIETCTRGPHPQCEFRLSPS
jgi:predicted ArsR family transcriptional regulator